MSSAPRILGASRDAKPVLTSTSTPTCQWETAAAQAVIEKAGGRVVTLEGKPLGYATPGETLNSHFIVWGH